MSVRIKAQMNSGETYHALYHDMETALAWLNRNAGKYMAAEIQVVSVTDIRQGRE